MNFRIDEKTKRACKLAYHYHWHDIILINLIAKLTLMENGLLIIYSIMNVFTVVKKTGRNWVVIELIIPNHILKIM